jgi:putative glycosyltransferase
MTLSILTTHYQSSRYMEEFHQRATAAAHAITDDDRLIFVNDGSPDDSLEVAKKLLAGDRHIIIADVSRNFRPPPRDDDGA